MGSTIVDGVESKNPIGGEPGRLGGGARGTYPDALTPARTKGERVRLRTGRGTGVGHNGPLISMIGRKEE